MDNQRRLVNFYGSFAIAIFLLCGLLIKFTYIIVLPLFLLGYFCFFYKKYKHYLYLFISLIIGLFLASIINYNINLQKNVYVAQKSPLSSFKALVLSDSVSTADASYKTILALKSTSSKLSTIDATGKIILYSDLFFNKGELLSIAKNIKSYVNNDNVLVYTVSTNKNSITRLGYASKINSYRASQKQAFINYTISRLGSLAGSLFVALITGDRSLLTPFTTYAFTHSGMVHILALSGWHVMVLSSVLLAIFKLIGLKKGQFFLIPFLALYLVFTDSPYSLQRSVLMVFMAILFLIKHYPIRSIDLLGFSFILILLMDSSAFFSQSFRLSYLAMLGMMLLGKYFDKGINKIYSKIYKTSIYKASLSQSFSSSVFSMPYTYNTFDSFYPLALITGGVIISLVCGFMLLAFVILVCPFSSLLAPLQTAITFYFNSLIDLLHFLTFFS